MSICAKLIWKALSQILRHMRDLQRYLHFNYWCDGVLATMPCRTTHVPAHRLPMSFACSGSAKAVRKREGWNLEQMNPVAFNVN